ncbi:MAG: CRTAC1 family protein [Acidobacteriota bacterium]|nr:CRTAC1 family protein [Acidobacteriota bacterium]
MTSTPVRAGLALSLTLVAPGVGAQSPLFEDATRELGIDFSHRHFGTGRKYMPENMGAGLAVFDVDGDGQLDVYLVQASGALPGSTGDTEATNRLFRQGADGRFQDVTEGSGVGHGGYGMGASFGDIDGDGDLDLFVTNYGPDALFRNDGECRFTEVAAGSELARDVWSSSAGMLDADNDGDLDLFVARYLDWHPANHKFCGNAQTGLRSYCHPDVYEGAPDGLFLNDGTGRFARTVDRAGIRTSANDKGLGLVLSDLNADGIQDIYVANDSTRNYLYLGSGKGTFREDALAAGVAVNARGAREASMGVELGDLNGDGLPDLFLTHLDEETNTLYMSSGVGLWVDRTEATGLAEPSRPWVGFGTVLGDFDHDGDEDLFVANGHIIDNIDRFDGTRRHRQPPQLFLNDGSGRFVERRDLLGVEGDLAGRAALGADIDDDGDLDLLITQNDGPTLVLRNLSSTATAGLRVSLAGSNSNPQGYGARIELAADGLTQRRWLKSASSYLSQGPPEVHFALRAETAVLTVYWPSGAISKRPDIRAGHHYTVAEDGASPPSRPFAKSQ